MAQVEQTVATRVQPAAPALHTELHIVICFVVQINVAVGTNATLHALGLAPCEMQRCLRRPPAGTRGARARRAHHRRGGAITRPCDTPIRVGVGRHALNGALNRPASKGSLQH